MAVARRAGEREDQPRGADRRRPLELLLHGAVARPGRRRTPPTTLRTKADVTFQPGEGITGIHLSVEGAVPGIDNDAFVAAAEEAKKNCPVSQALTGTTITLDAKLA